MWHKVQDIRMKGHWDMRRMRTYRHENKWMGTFAYWDKGTKGHEDIFANQLGSKNVQILNLPNL